MIGTKTLYNIGGQENVVVRDISIISIIILLLVLSHWKQGKARRLVPPLNTHCLERSVLTISVTYLRCNMRDTA